MISLADAFGAETTTMAGLKFVIPGYWNADNQWVAGGHTPPIQIPATIVPVGDYSESTHGQAIKADPTGERYPASVKIKSRWQIPINSIVEFHGIDYKITRVGDYLAADFWACVGQSDTTTAKPVVTPLSDIPDDLFVMYGRQRISVKQLLETQAIVQQRRS